MADRIVAATLTEVYRLAAERFGSQPAFVRRGKDGSFETITFADLYDDGLSLASALISLGLKAREHVALLSDNRLEWIVCDYGVLLAGAADVPRGADITESEIRYILNHSDARIAFVENAALLEKARKAHPSAIEHWIVMSGNADENASSLPDLIEYGRRLRREGDHRAEERAAAVQPGDLFTIIYTSGTTGTPKGAQLTHANMCSQIKNLPFELSPDDRALSILPIWHSYERVFEMVAIAHGTTTYYTTIRTVAEDLREIRPTIMASAPRLWENLYEKIMHRVQSGGAVTGALFRLAYHAAREVRRAQQFFNGQELDVSGRRPAESARRVLQSLTSLVVWSLPFKLLDKVVLAKLRAAVGGEFRGTVSGGGALPAHVDEFFNFIGIPVLEGYGLTETSPVLAVRTWDNLVIGTVGPIYRDCEVRIVDLNNGEILYPNLKLPGDGRGLRGEIHVRGPQVMKGYYKDEAATSRVLQNGWFNTGDIGMITYNNCLKILGRSKDTIVLRNGENVEPVPIENKLCHSPVIDQCMIVGQDEKFIGALVVPNLDRLRARGIALDSLEAAAADSSAREIVGSEIKRLVNGQSGFKPFERIAAWALVPKKFEVGDELTATLKIKRHAVTEKYSVQIRSMFEPAGSGD